MAGFADAANAVLSSVEKGSFNLWKEEHEKWHEEDCEWHKEDVDSMNLQRGSWEHERLYRRLRYRWREEDMVQRNLENARCLWLRYVEKNQRDAEEKSEQLRAISNLAAIFAGFAVVNLTQFVPDEPYSWVVTDNGFAYKVAGGLIMSHFPQIYWTPCAAHCIDLLLEDFTKIPSIKKVLFSVYGILTALVEGLMTISMITSTLLLLAIFKVGKLYVNEHAEEEFIFQCLQFCKNYEEGDRPPCPQRTMEAFWECRCESSWQLAFFCFSSGVSFFILSTIVIGWIMFSGQSKATSSIFVFICGIAVVIWCFIHCAWGKYIKRQKTTLDRDNHYGDPSGLPYDWYLAPSFRSTY